MAKYKTVEKNGTTYYCTTFTYNGKKYDLTAKTTQELDDKVQKKKQELEYGALNNANMKVKVWAERWLETYKKPNIVHRNYTNYRGIINNIIVPRIGNLKMSDIQHIHLQDLLNSLTTYSFWYVNYVKNTLSGMFSIALDNKIIRSDPAHGLIVSNKLSKGSHRVMRADEEKALVKVCDTHRFGLFPLFMLYCGMRNGEALALTWNDIDIKERIINIDKALESGKGQIKAPKTPSGVRKVPIPKIFLERLKKEKEGKDLNALVVTTYKGTQCKDVNVYWKSIKKEMDISAGAEAKDGKIVKSALWEDEDDALTPYCLRHTYCTNLFRSGVHINVAKYLMGHSNVQIVTEIYGHQTDDQTVGAMNLLDRYYNGKKKKV